MFNKYSIKVLFLGFLIIFSSISIFAGDDGFSITSPTYFAENNNVYKDIHYLENEFLSFMFCPKEEITNLEFYIQCQNEDNFELEVFETSDDRKICFFSNQNLIDVQCNDFDLIAEYDQSNKKKKIVRSFVEQKQSKLINHVLGKNYESLDDLDLSYFLVIQNDIEGQDSKLSNEIYNLLKNSRDNTDKCWPDNNCDLSSTIKILKNLVYANYDANSRLIEDGRNYIEKNILTNDEGSSTTGDTIIYDFSIEIDHNFGNNEEISCELIIDNDYIRNYIFDEDSDSGDLLLEKDFAELVEFDCDEDFDDFEFKVLNGNLLIYEELFSDDDRFTYEIKSENEFEFTIEIDHTFRNNEEINCTLEIDETGDIYNYVFDDNTDSDDLLIEKNVEDKIEFLCDANFDEIIFELFNVFGNREIDENYETQNSLIYDVPTDFSLYACVGEDENCNYYDTLDALLIYNSNLDYSRLLDSYIDDQVETENSEVFVNVVDEIIDSSKYLIYKKNNEIKDYLKFNQNNEGSWGSGKLTSKINPTAFSILGLQNVESESEYVLDAKKWIYFNEPFTGWNSIENDVYAYLAIKEQIKPYLKIDVINEMSAGINLITIVNPTIYNLRDLEVSFSKEINSHLSYLQDLGNLNGEEDLVLNINLSDTFFGKLSGEMIITGIDGKGSKIEFLKMPINIVGPQPFSFVDEEEYAFVDEDPFVKVKIESQLESFSTTCNYLNPFSDFEEELVITQNTESIDILNLEMMEGTFNLDLNCKFETLDFKNSLLMNVVLSEKSFNIVESQITLNNINDFSIELNSLLKDKQVVDIDFITSYFDLIEVAESSKIIAGNDTRELFFTVIDPVLLESLNGTTIGEIVITSDAGYSKKISVISDFGVVLEEVSPFRIYYISIGVFLGIIFVIFIIRRYRYLHSEHEHPQTGEDEMYLDDVEFK